MEPRAPNRTPFRITLVPILRLQSCRWKPMRGLVPRLSVYACESQPVTVEGLQRVLAECEDLEFVGSLSRPTEAMEALARIRPDIVLIDLAGGLTPALRLVSALRASSSKSLPVLWVVDL